MTFGVQEEEGKVILPILVTQLELGRVHFLQQTFREAQSGFLLQIVRTAVVITFVEGAIRAVFPAIESLLTVRTPVDGFARSIARGEGRQAGADFAENLSGLAAIVEVEVVSRSLAVARATKIGGRAVKTDITAFISIS